MSVYEPEGPPIVNLVEHTPWGVHISIDNAREARCLRMTEARRLRLLRNVILPRSARICSEVSAFPTFRM
jgi:hypothetical protein